MICACPGQNVAKRDASGKKAKLSACKCIFDQIKANLAEIQPKNHQNAQETPFLQKTTGVDGLNRSRKEIMLQNLVLFELPTVTFTLPSYKSRCTKHLSVVFYLVGHLF